MAGIILLAVVLLMGAASALGWTADSRDARYGLGPVTGYRRLPLLDEEQIGAG